MTDANSQYEIVSWAGRDAKYSVYVLKPGQCFERFGGSRAGLVVRETPSLIVSRSGRDGVTHTEYDVHDIKVWRNIFEAIRRQK